MSGAVYQSGVYQEGVYERAAGTVPTDAEITIIAGEVGPFGKLAPP